MAYMHLLWNIYSIAKSQNLTKKTITTYTDKKQVIDYSSLPSRSSGPTSFMIEDYDPLDGIRNFTTGLKPEDIITFQQKHIYSHLEDKRKQQEIVKNMMLEFLITTFKTKLQDS